MAKEPKHEKSLPAVQALTMLIAMFVLAAVGAFLMSVQILLVAVVAGLAGVILAVLSLRDL